MISLKDGAIFIADVHYAPYRADFLDFLKKIDKEPPPQLFLMGDIFDFLVGGVSRSISQNRDAIELINLISQKTELFYLEGNHDYNLKNLFPHARVFSRKSQPAIFDFYGKRVAISHGDIHANGLHELYFSIISNRALLQILDTIDTKLLQNYISKKINRWLERKNICRMLEHFEQMAKKRVSNYQKYDVVIEGHYHQDVKFVIDDKRYISVGAFACNRSYFCVESLNNGLDFKKVCLKEV